MLLTTCDFSASSHGQLAVLNCFFQYFQEQDKDQSLFFACNVDLHCESGGMRFTVTVVENYESTTIMIDDANVLQADMKASNGIIHAIDRVLIPEGLELPYKSQKNATAAESNGGNNSTTIPDDTNPNNSTTIPDAPAEELENRLFDIAAGISSLEVLSVEGSPQASSLRKLIDDALALLLENGVSISDLEALQR